MRVDNNLQVLEWIDDQYTNNLYVSSITIAEVQLGIALLPDGKRKTNLIQAAVATFSDFKDTQLNFTEASAFEYAAIVSTCVRMGRPISVEDAQIASIAKVSNAFLVTRNVSDFDMIDGLTTLNPFNN